MISDILSASLHLGEIVLLLFMAGQVARHRTSFVYFGGRGGGGGGGEGRTATQRICVYNI